jgi:hypothetical protein
MDKVIIVLFILVFIISIVSLSFGIIQITKKEKNSLVIHDLSVTDLSSSSEDPINVTSGMIVDSVTVSNSLTLSNASEGYVLTAVNDTGLAEWKESSDVESASTETIDGSLVVFNGNTGKSIRQPSFTQVPRVNDVNGQLQGVTSQLTPGFTFVGSDGTMGLFQEDDVIGLVSSKLSFPNVVKKSSNEFFDEYFYSGTVNSIGAVGNQGLDLFYLKATLDDDDSEELEQIISNNAIVTNFNVEFNVSGQLVHLSDGEPIVTLAGISFSAVVDVKRHAATGDLMCIPLAPYSILNQHHISMVVGNATEPRLQCRTIGHPILPSSGVNDYYYNYSSTIKIQYPARNSGFKFTITPEDIGLLFSA